MTYLAMPEWLKNIPSLFISVPLTMVVMWLFFLLFGKRHHVEETPEVAEAYVQERASQVVRVGRDNYDEMWESVKDAALDSGVDEKLGKSILNDEIIALKLEQRTWPDLTDNDRLKAAFYELKGMGYHVGAGMVEDPSYEISLARKAAKNLMRDGRSHLGYIFYTYENAEDAILGAPIEFWYGSVRRKLSASDNLKIAKDLNSALEKQGLETNWNGNENSQVSLNLDWKVRWDESRMQSD